MDHRRSKNLPKGLVIKIISVFILVVCIATFSLLKIKKNNYPDNITISIKGQNYYLEVAKTKEGQQKGLSNRDQLCLDCGMFFPFGIPGRYSFWMKDTNIPLDIIWLNSKLQVVKIITAVNTNSELIYTNKKLAKYAIELNANESFRLGLNVGDTIAIIND